MKQRLSKKSVICFHRWTRKSYAVFNSLGKQVKIGVLAFGLSIVTLSTQAVSAQDKTTHSEARESEDEAVPIDDVTILAVEKTLATVNPARVVTVISRKEISQLPVQDLPQLLEYVAGVDLRQRGANGVQADISIRGGNFDQSLILLNGINLTDPQTGHYNLDLPVDLESIDRVELLQGPGSRTIGPHAFAGTINIVTGTAAQNQVQARAEAGCYGYYNWGANGTAALKKWTLFANISQKKSDGYVDNTDFDIINLFAQVRYADSTLGQWNLQLGRQQKGYGANGFYSLTYPNQYEKTSTNLATLDYAKSIGKFHLLVAAYYRQHYDKFELFRSRPPAWYTSHNYHRTDVAGTQLRAHFFSPLGKTMLGGEIRGEHIYSNVLGDPVSRPKPVKNEPDGIFYTKEKQRNIASWFAQQVYYHHSFSIAGGLQGSYSNSFGHYLCASADAAYSFTKALEATISANSSLRLPTYTDLYYQGATNTGNPDLKPEQAATYELGLKYMQPELKMQTSVFYRVGKNIIDWVRSNSTELWQSKNHISLNTLGATFTGTYSPKNSVKRFLSSAKLDYTCLQMYLDGNNMETSRTLDYLKHKIALTCIYDLAYGFGFSWSLIHERRNGQYVDFTSQLSTNFSPVTLVDAKLFWSYKYVLLYVETSNLFSYSYFDYANLQQPGRWTKSGIRIKI
ncbi:MAG: TonB-dependent receptor [Prevotellaceae bacterium]|jgi:iron complex outermembrane receptor protein|nr:TonB-dependent receptor [Prevotellaceae bacterium]